MFDSKQMLIDSQTDVTGTATGSALDFRGEDMAELVYRILVPTATAGSMKVRIEQSEDGSTNWTPIVESDTIDKAGVYHVHARAKKRFRRAAITVNGAGNFGKVRVGTVPAGTYRDW